MKKFFLLQLVIWMVITTNAQHLDTHAYFNSTNTAFIDLGKGSTIPKINALSAGDKLTIALWVKWGSKTAAGVTEWANLITLNDTIGSGDNGVFWVQHSQDNKKFEFALTTTVGNTSTRDYIQSNTQAVIGTWYHIVCVYDGSLNNNNMKIYVNGKQEASMNKKGNIKNIPTASKINIGRWANSNNSYRRFNGSIDEITISNSALTKNQIGLLMNNADSFALSNAKATSIISYYNFEYQAPVDLAGSPINGIGYSGVSYLNSDIANLPIELMDFVATAQNTTAVINWTTASEINNDFFTIEKSYDGETFEEIATIKGAGNSNKILNYKHIADEIKSGVVYYRLKQTDFDGMFTYSNLVQVIFGEKSNVIVYPNPANQGKEINISGLSEDVTTVKVFSLSGILMAEYSQIQDGNVKIESNELQKGMYLVQYTTTIETKTLLFNVH